MRSKKAIEKRIKELEYIVGNSNYPEKYRQYNRNHLRALRWVMGIEQEPEYFCTDCEGIHEGTKCPVCGNESVIMPMEYTVGKP